MSTAEAELFFQTDTSIATNRIRASKAKNESGRPIRLGRPQQGTKILDVLAVRRGNANHCNSGGEKRYGMPGEEKRYRQEEEARGGRKMDSSSLFVAESGGWVREVCLGTTETTAIYTGPTAPLTSLAFSAATSTLYAGCWDTCIWAWKVKAGEEEEEKGKSEDASGDSYAKKPRQIRGYRFTPASSGGHAGFVKTLRLARLVSQSYGGKAGGGDVTGREVLVSGGADGAIYIWDTMSGKRIISGGGDDNDRGNGSVGGGGNKSLKGLDRSVSALAFDPFINGSDNYDDGQVTQKETIHEDSPQYQGQDQDQGQDSKTTNSSHPIMLFSAGSGVSIRRWVISSSLSSSSSTTITTTTEEEQKQKQTLAIQALPLSPLPPHTHHASSISALAFDKHGDLWTASTDRTVRHLVRDRDWAVDTQLEHPDVVTDVLVLDVDPDLDMNINIGQDGFGSEYNDNGKNEGWIATACRDEEVRVWDGVSGTLLHTFSGHFAPVSSLCLASDGSSSKSSARDTLISVSLDGTIRRWRLDRLREAVRLAAHAETETQCEKVGGGGGDGGIGGSGEIGTEENEKSMQRLRPGTDEWEDEEGGKNKGKGEDGDGDGDGDGDNDDKKRKKASLMTEEEERELEELMGDDDDDDDG